MAGVYKVHAVTIGTDDPTSPTDITLWQVSTSRASYGIESLIQAANNVDNVFAGAQQQKPMLSIETPALASFLDTVDPDGAAINEVILYLAKMDHGGRVVAGSNHETLTFKQAHVIPRSIRAEQGSEAMLSADIVATFDGTNNPLAHATGVALPTFPDPFTPEKFTVGPVYFNTAAKETQSVNLDFGLKDQQYWRDGELYPRVSAIVNRTTEIAVETHDANLFNTITDDGLSQATVQVHFRRMTNKGSPVADATETHIGFTYASTYIEPQEIGGSDGEALRGSYIVRPINDGTNAYFAMDTTSAIS